MKEKTKQTFRGKVGIGYNKCSGMLHASFPPHVIQAGSDDAPLPAGIDFTHDKNKRDLANPGYNLTCLFTVTYQYI